MSGSEGREDAAESAASIYLCPMPDDVSKKHVTVATPAVTAIILPLHVLLSVDYTTVVEDQALLLSLSHCWQW